MEMTAKQSSEYHNRLPLDVQFQIGGSLFVLDKELLALKSEKLAKLLRASPEENPSHLLHEIPADQESWEIVARFCHGYETNLSTENVVRVTCVAHYLGMTETHCANNLLNKALLFFQQEIIPSWNKSIKALKSAEVVFQQSLQLGLVDYCVESIITKVMENPSLLGDPISNLISDDDSDENEHGYRQCVERKLFKLNWNSEDLTVLSLRLYKYIIQIMLQRVPLEYVAANLCAYAKKWIFSREHDLNSQKETIEVLERLLPHERGVLPCTFLFEMLRFALEFDAGPECKSGLELRIGKQLDQATVRDLLMPSQGSSNEEKYDTKCVLRILKKFYSNYIGASELISVAELMDEFLAEISADIDMKMSTFIAFAEMSVAASAELPRNSDGIYRAIDIYLDKHRHLTASEREELCRVLDSDKLSQEACKHAIENNKLPTRLVVQLLFTMQLKLRDLMAEEVKGLDGHEDEAVTKFKKMGTKVLELERECSAIRREIQRGGSSSGVERPRQSIWKQMKKKLGCTTATTVHDCNCHMKKQKKKKDHPK